MNTGESQLKLNMDEQTEESSRGSFKFPCKLSHSDRRLFCSILVLLAGLILCPWENLGCNLWISMEWISMESMDIYKAAKLVGVPSALFTAITARTRMNSSVFAPGHEAGRQPHSVCCPSQGAQKLP